MAQTEPGSTTWPASRVTPRAPTVLASQTSELSGEPSTAPPAPVPTTWPLRWKVAPGEAQVDRADVGRGRAEHDGARAGVVGDGVEQADLPVADPAVDDLERRQHEVDGAQRLVHRDARALERLLQHEGDLGLDARLDEPVDRDRHVLEVEEVVEQVAVVGLGDAEQPLHRGDW